MLSNKYKPKFQKDLCISPKSVITDIKNWITLLNSNSKQLLVLLGPVGCGKSLFLNILFKAYNRLYIESDNIKQSDIIDSIIGYKEQTFHDKSNKKNIVIVENIENCEKSINNFIDTVHVKKNIPVPIIVTANNIKLKEQFNNFQNCTFIVFEYPNTKDLYNLVDTINKQEELKLSSENIYSIIKKAEGDYRQLFGILDQWILQLKINPDSSFESFDLNISCKYKDIDLYDKLDYLINNQDYDFNKTYYISTSEVHGITLGIYQNYISQKNISIDCIAEISDNLSHANNINNEIYTNQHWELYDDYAVSGCIITSYLIKQNNLEKIEIKQFKDISYNFENSLNEIKMLILKNNYENKIFKN